MMKTQGRYASASSLTTMPNMLVPEIVLRLLEEQANTISKIKLNKIGFRVLVRIFIYKKVIHINKLIPELNHEQAKNMGIKYI